MDNLSKLPKSLFSLQIQSGPEISFSEAPLWLSGLFRFYKGEIGSQPCIFVVPQSKYRTPEIMKLVEEVSNYDSRPLVLFVPNLSYSQKNKLAELNISFIATEFNAYVPFIGIAIKGASKKVAPSSLLSPQAQLIVVNALLGVWEKETSSHLAKSMNKSLPSVSNYLDELEAILPAIVHKVGRVRSLNSTVMSRRILFDTVLPYLDNPVRRELYVNDAAQDLLALGAVRSGYTALSQYSDLAEPELPVLAMTTRQLRYAETKGSINKTLIDEEAQTCVQVWKYWSPLWDKRVVDPLSLYCSMKAEMLDDPRVNKALQQLLDLVLDEGATTF